MRWEQNHSIFEITARLEQLLVDSESDAELDREEISEWVCWLEKDRFERRTVNRRLRRQYARGDEAWRLALVATTVNAAPTLMYWRIGVRVRQHILGEGRAEYGSGIVSALTKQLVGEYGSGFGEKNLRRMIQFAEAFQDERIVVTLSRQLSWSHFLALIPLRASLQRDFYAELCRVER